ncbi:hypothetical protein TrLO_g12102 [Triparma laevis f. longispina]|uniref:Aminopeptidase N n=1 Tax=Triparma laevis f. longispina TaxID=1714387 RepID=A0A9W7KYB1_9STRA|nr:hypothetical protein TrLO_g12102 [Triparma laevis f. longispina]
MRVLLTLLTLIPALAFNSMLASRSTVRRMGVLSPILSAGGTFARPTSASKPNRFTSLLSKILPSRSNTCKSSSRLYSTAEAPTEIFRADYLQPANWVKSVSMSFDIYDGKTIVKSNLVVVANEQSKHDSRDLVLDGDGSSVVLKGVEIEGRELKEGIDYTLTPSQLIIHSTSFPNPQSFTLSTTVETVPEDNTQLSGFYKSGPMYCTQCEAEGFRRITYYPDRPDNMATFTEVKITADEEKYPILLSNGNLVSSEKKEGGRHEAVWEDPFPKPSYLFAVVVGDLGSIQDSYVTTSGRKVKLEIFSEKENVGKLDYAMESLKNSMKWDEDKFGLEYDLDIYNVVAVNDFNMGAMENKGLNVFNTAYVLADQKTATDGDFERVEGVIGHEYFHNWTGNRVTCRDWFQLTLKEGLTVFRDQSFSGDMGSNDVTRIENVKGLRGRQFAEDAGPMSHPIRPESYVAIDNFYTATVYSKGAEVIRMYDTILGKAGFRKGMDLYFERHDGSAATCDDFRSAMADANNADLDQFSRWYTQKGTPTVKYSSSLDADTFTLNLSQHTATAPENQPFHIPVEFGVIDSETGEQLVESHVLHFKEKTQSFTFKLSSTPKGSAVPSVMRGFSAPVKLVSEASPATQKSDLLTLAAYDTDGFNRWEAGQKLYTDAIFAELHGDELNLDGVYQAFEQTLTSSKISDDSIRAYGLMLPSESGLAEEMETIDPIGLHQARTAIKKKLARKFETGIAELYARLTQEMAGAEFEVNAKAIGKRRLRNTALDYVCANKDSDEEIVASARTAHKHYFDANCMTDQVAAMSILSNVHGVTEAEALRDEVLEKFYNAAEGDALVLNKWFTIQATSSKPDVLADVVKLTTHPEFTMSNPNRCRSLVGAFTANSAAFHAEDGSGYKFIGEKITVLDAMNPQIASRMVGCLIGFRRYDEGRAEKMKAELNKIRDIDGLSPDTKEIVDKALS